MIDASSDERLNCLIELTVVHFFQKFFEPVHIVEVSRQCWKSLETVSGVVVRNSSVFHSQLSNYLCLFRNSFLGKHADISANSENFFSRNSVTVEGATIPENKISCLCINFHAITERLLWFVILGNQIPIFFEVQHPLLFKVLSVMFVWSRSDNETALLGAWVRKCEHALIAPHIISCGRLVAVQEGVNGGLLVVAPSVHEAKSIKRALQMLAVPQLLKKRHRAFTQLPLYPRMTHVLNHASMQNWRIVLTQDLSLWIFSIESAVGQYLHNVPKILNILLALLLRKPSLNHYKTLIIEVLSPTTLIFKVKAVFLFNLHPISQRIIIS